MELPRLDTIIEHFAAAQARDNGALSECFMSRSGGQTARWFLTHRRDNHRLGGAKLLVIGKNPSEAKVLATKAQGGDATSGIIRERLEDGTLDTVFGRRIGWVTVANLLPVVNKNPRGLTKRDKERLSRTNQTLLRHLITTSDAIWIAWGQTWGMPWAQQTIPDVVGILKGHTQVPMKALWTQTRSADGEPGEWYPHHPQRITITPDVFGNVDINEEGLQRPRPAA